MSARTAAATVEKSLPVESTIEAEINSYGARLYVAAGDEANGLPTIKVAYSVLGDTLRIRMVMVQSSR
jgi:hypothetical protein